MYMSVCPAPEGIGILHGNRGYFHADKQPAFKTAYRIVEEYTLGTDLYRNFLMQFESALSDDIVHKSNCGKAADKFLIQSKELFKETEYYYNNS